MEEDLTQVFAREQIALRTAVSQYKHWHGNSNLHGNWQKDPLRDILQVTFKINLLTPEELAEQTRGWVTAKDLIRCAEEGITPGRKERGKITQVLKKTLGIQHTFN